MAARESQIVVEGLIQPSVVNARESQLVVEYLYVYGLTVTGATGGTVNLVGGSGGTISGPAVLNVTGISGDLVEVRGGDPGAVGNPLAGQTGGTIQIQFGAGGSLGLNITGAVGATIQLQGGSGGKISLSITGYWGSEIELRGGTTGAIFPVTSRHCTVFVNGVDRSAWVEAGIRRQIQMGSGSRAVSQFRVNNKGRATWRPLPDDDVVIYEGIARFFAGIIDSTSEYDFSGTAALHQIDVACIDDGCRLDGIVVGTHFEVWRGGILSVTVGQLASQYLEPLGITYVPTGDPLINLGVQTFNWVTFTDALNSICGKCNWDWRVDFNKTLYCFPKDTGYAAALFPLASNDGNWAEMRVNRSRAQRRNRQYVRNSQDLRPLWTDTFIGDGQRLIWPTTAMLTSAPQIKVGGVEKIVVNEGEYSGTWDFVWEPFSVMANPAAPPALAAIIAVTYPSPLSDVAVAEDLADIAIHGPIEAVEEARDVADRIGLQAIADGILARALLTPVSIAFRTDRSGLEPGHLLVVNTARPPVTESLVIMSVESEEQGKRFFRHQVTASNAPQLSGSNAAFYQRLAARTKQARDRTTYTLAFGLAETIEGLTNSGLTTGLKMAILTAPKSGVLRDCTLRFRSVDDGTPTTSLIEIDVLKNGISIFGTKHMEYAAGAAGLKTQFIFSANPLIVTKDDAFTINVLQADVLATDGVLALTVIG